MQLLKKTYKAADGTRKKCRVWTVRYSIRGRSYEKSLGTRDRGTAQSIAASLIRKSELRAAGLLDPFEEHREKPIREHMADFEATVRGRGVTPQYVHDRMRCLTTFVEETGARRLADLDVAVASRWLLTLRDPPRSLAARGVNGYVRALLQLTIWLVRNRRLPYNPLEGLRTLNEEEDRRRVRRALTPEEAARLVEAARTRPLAEATAQRVRAGVTPRERVRLSALGEARARLYTLALGTGLRRGELRRLRWADLDLEHGLVRVPAASAKSRREQAVELHAGLLAALRAARPLDVDPAAPVVPAHVFPTTRSFHADLVAAGLAREERIPLASPTKRGTTFKRRWDTTDATGRIIDFHALRTTFITWLGLTGAHPRTAQALARHSTMDLTMRVYTDVRLLDQRAAVDRLPLPAVGATTPAAPTAGRANARPSTWARQRGDDTARLSRPRPGAERRCAEPGNSPIRHPTSVANR